MGESQNSMASKLTDDSNQHSASIVLFAFLAMDNTEQ